MMRDAFLLFRVQWTGMVGLNRALHGRRKAGALIKWIAIAALVSIYLPGALGMYCYLMASGLQAVGQLRLFPSVAKKPPAGRRKRSILQASGSSVWPASVRLKA